MSCTCFTCARERHKGDPPELRLFGSADGTPVALMRMFLCDACGNKRCPHAMDHANTCTGSNAPGQKGSLYEDCSFEAASTRPAQTPEAASGTAKNPIPLPPQGGGDQ